MKFYHSLTQIELELTTRCNAACPQCARNYYGGRTWPSLPIVDLPFETIKSLAGHLSVISHVKLCGTYGDPCIHPDLLDIVDWIRTVSDCAITINTNGGMHRESWWRQLGQKLQPQDKVFFGIDGLEDTHHLYRRGTDFARVIRNVTALNSTGAHTVWSYLVFDHNQHQVEQARALSQEIGCGSFAVKSTSRFVDKTHNLVDTVPVQDRRDRVIYWLKPATDNRYVNSGYDVIKDIGDYAEYLKTNEIRCQAQHTGYVVVSAEGYVLPCGFLHDRFYGYEAESHPDRAKLFSLIDSAGGLDAINIAHHDLSDIINGSAFQRIKQSWTNADRLQRCAHQCGVEHRLFQHANRDLALTWTGKTLIDL